MLKKNKSKQHLCVVGRGKKPCSTDWGATNTSLGRFGRPHLPTPWSEQPSASFLSSASSLLFFGGLVLHLPRLWNQCSYSLRGGNNGGIAEYYLTRAKRGLGREAFVFTGISDCCASPRDTRGTRECPPPASLCPASAFILLLSCAPSLACQPPPFVRHY